MHLTGFEPHIYCLKISVVAVKSQYIKLFEFLATLPILSLEKEMISNSFTNIYSFLKKLFFVESFNHDGLQLESVTIAFVKNK